MSCDIYIGRPIYQGGWQLPGSKWANSFRLGPNGENRTQALEAYERHVRSSPELMGALSELRGKRLGCWCKPLPCHGDVLVRLLAEQSAQGDASALPLAEQSAQGDAPALPLAEQSAPRDDMQAIFSIPDDDPIWGELGL